MTLQNFQTEFQSRSDDTIDAGQITSWLNQSLQEMIIPLGNNQNTSTRTSATSTTVASQASYALPANFIRPISLWVDSTQYSWIEPEDRLNTALSQSYYIDEANGNFVLVLAPTTSGSTITLFYEKDLTELSNLTDEPPFPARFHEGVLYGALRRYYEQQKEFGKVSTYAALFTNMQSELVEFYNSYEKNENTLMGTYYDTNQTDF